MGCMGPMEWTEDLIFKVFHTIQCNCGYYYTGQLTIFCDEKFGILPLRPIWFAHSTQAQLGRPSNIPEINLSLLTATPVLRQWQDRMEDLEWRKDRIFLLLRRKGVEKGSKDRIKELYPSLLPSQRQHSKRTVSSFAKSSLVSQRSHLTFVRLEH